MVASGDIQRKLQNSEPHRAQVVKAQLDDPLARDLV